MLGYPGETHETIQMTKDFIRRIPMDIMNLTKFTPYPGSPIYKDLYGTNIRDDHWEKMNGMNFVWAPAGFTVEELDRQYQAVLSAFYRRPRLLFYYFVMTLRYPTHLLRLLRCGLGYLNAKLKSYLNGRRGVLVRPGETDLNTWSMAEKIGGPH
jgi:anaerobic magnesium-protoporphyrin IX monomethyl ester cyclase